MTHSLLSILLLSSLSLAAQPYVRGGVAAESAEGVTLLDVDCRSARPPALFGCGAGNDGRPFGARGGLQRGLGFELAIGREVGRGRAEVSLTSRSGLELEAQANFTGVAGKQPVSARVQSLSLLIAGTVDLAPNSWRVRPFLTGGAGVDLTARHTDLGHIRGARGDAIIVRPTRTLRLEVATIETEWQTRGVHLSVRRRF